jgi:glycosyltransferase involved in cell wall biosynthesis
MYSTADQHRDGREGGMTIAMLAPPWIPVPPPGYGGIESVVALLTDGLVRRGNEVTLFAAPGSASPATVREVLPSTHEDEVEKALHESDHVARAFEAVEHVEAEGTPFDVLHDHCGFTALAMADRLGVPMVHTLHGPFTGTNAGFYQRHWPKVHVVAISETQKATAPDGVNIAGVVPNPIDAGEWSFRAEKGDYLLWVGRMAEVKGPHRAIAAAREAGVPLRLGGVVHPGQEEFFAAEVEPHIDGESVTYVGEVGGEAKKELFAGARALLMPIRWAEPFGMVMVEAMACGTPVIAFPEGAASDIVRDGETGFLVNDEHEMASAVNRLGELDPVACRNQVMECYDVEQVAAAYEDVYRRAAAASPRAQSRAP